VASGDGYIRLVHWSEEEAPERAARLESHGYDVDATVPGTSIGLRALREDPPLAFVIDLSRLPSHGREVARSVRQSTALRVLPLVFVGGKPDKAAQAEDEFPDAAFTSWEQIEPALAEAIAHPPVDPVVPVSDSGPSSGTPLVRKLGIGAGSTVALVDAPENAERTIGDLPDGAHLRRGNRGQRDITIWFVTESAAFERRLAAIAKAAGEGALWIAWPKGSSALDTDLTQTSVMEPALAAGLVDSKVCAIDEDWSALRFTRRRTPAE
jgi:CheY-like chemotaxis protein